MQHVTVVAQGDTRTGLELGDVDALVHIHHVLALGMHLAFQGKGLFKESG